MVIILGSSYSPIIPLLQGGGGPPKMYIIITSNIINGRITNSSGFRVWGYWVYVGVIGGYIYI